MKKFIEFIADIMEVNPTDINMDTEYREFEKWDSLMMLTLVMEIEAEYGVSIPMEKLGSVETLGDLYTFVENC